MPCEDKKKAPVPQPAADPTLATSVLLTGGIGDVITLESMFPEAMRERLETIYYACPASAEIRQLFPALPNYPKLRNHIVLPTGARTHYSHETVEKAAGALPPEVADWSIAGMFPRALPYTGSSFAEHRLAPPPLEGEYAIVVGETTWGKMPGRDFTTHDWAAVLACLEKRGMRGIVLSRDPCEIPAHPLLSQRQLPILAAIEAVKGASAYLGIDSWAACMWARCRKPDAFTAVKSVNPQYYQWKHVYNAPQTEFSFIGQTIPAILTPKGPRRIHQTEADVHPHHHDERAELFSAVDGGSVEGEVGELLAALVRAYKPELILETGTYLGVAAKLLAGACTRNGFGRVITLECDPARATAARDRLAPAGNVEVVTADSLSWLRSYSGPPFGLIVLDSEIATRVEELRIIRERGLALGPVFVHDTSRLRFATMPDYPRFASELDALQLSGIECHLSRGWRLFDLRRP